MNIKKVVILYSAQSQSDLALSVIRCLERTREYKVFVLGQGDSANVKYSKGLKLFDEKFNFSDSEKLLSLIQQIATQYQLDVLLPICEKSIQFCKANENELVRYLKLVDVPEVEAMNIASDKSKLADFCKNNNFPVPEIYKPLEDDNYRFPIIAKPVTGHSGGHGIQCLVNNEELVEHLNNAKLESGQYLYQSKINGYDIGVSVLCKNGEIKAMTVQEQVGDKRNPFGPLERLKFVKKEELELVIVELMKKLNWSGVAHIDCCVDKDTQKIYILEINPRYWQSLIASYIAGVNFADLACKMALGHRVELKEYQLITFGPIRHGFKLKAQSRLKTVLPIVLRDWKPVLFSKLSNVKRALTHVSD
ncbi:ATP-grasp domain-containing protein [Aliikangiella sp. IMCC44359]|uniref:ATP-grasp domain-containing protein n=1 Tax=Aliikangiella sp. IMCC44359 TaxID=3459125 RepID=UPI00403B21C9